MKMLRETFFERLCNRLGPRTALKVMANLHRARRSGIDYMVVKEASELLERYRHEMRSAVRSYRQWQACEAVTQALSPLRAQEGRQLQAHARALTHLVLDARRDYKDLCELAIARCERAND